MSTEERRPASEDLTSCCADMYSSDLATLLLGDSFHPGGLELTHRLAEMLELDPGARVLDVASGRGGSAIVLAEQFGCEVVGVDVSATNVDLATAFAVDAGVAERVHFVIGEASHLDVPSGSFDAVLCECALCTFANQPGAVSEFARVLRPGGRVGLSDVTRQGILPPELESLLSRIACIAGAIPVAEYARMLETERFAVMDVEPHDEALRELIERIQQRIFGAQLLTRLKQLDLPGVDLDQASLVARSAVSAVGDGRLGYMLLVAQAPATGTNL